MLIGLWESADRRDCLKILIIPGVFWVAAENEPKARPRSKSVSVPLPAMVVFAGRGRDRDRGARERKRQMGNREIQRGNADDDGFAGFCLSRTSSTCFFPDGVRTVARRWLSGRMRNNQLTGRNLCLATTLRQNSCLISLANLGPSGESKF